MNTNISIKPTQPNTQAKRRAATREALLEATVESLTEVGYVATTTRGVAKRAGVSQGALQHHFSSKALLVNAAISYIVERIARSDMLKVAPAGSERERAEKVIDRLWAAHNLPIARAVYELFHIARTDADMAYRISQTLAQGIQLVHAMIQSVLPTLSGHANFDAWLYRSETLMRGTVMLTNIPGATKGYGQWPDIREDILRALDGLLTGTTDATYTSN